MNGFGLMASFGVHLKQSAVFYVNMLMIVKQIGMGLLLCLQMVLSGIYVLDEKIHARFWKNLEVKGKSKIYSIWSYFLGLRGAFRVLFILSYF